MVVDCDELLGLGVTRPHPLLICLLGSFRMVRRGVVLPVRPGGKTEGLLCALAMRSNYRVDRDTLLGLLWPDVEATRAVRSLNSLVHSLRRLVGDALHGAPPVIYTNGASELNVDAGVSVDVAEFERRVDDGDRLMRSGDVDSAVRSYMEATALYVGDAVVGGDLHGFVERERLRARHLSLLASLADHHFAVGDYPRALRMALRLLNHDPCREDAHRLVMRCYARTGARSQALRQYRVCRRILAQEYQAAPEPTTEALFRRLLTDPAAV
jgi:DNA-binding SARP family transcriptional activator